ncbi:hypothetical protein O6H91_21G047300 [Diphasiastrum complanatum]|uniref:Uncharacterized protein n=1 Tax=Diphasiastrum complanatum TaxID=34168 RepID=A0ACC2AK45_DIPCM|nr:hypothetical protein O6H91_21G047300 [Diphasiastrum complanatum]
MKTCYILHSRMCNIQLPMIEHRPRQIQSNHVHSLPLCFVYCHGKCCSNRKLDPLQFKRYIRIAWHYRDTCNKDSTPYILPGHYLCLYDLDDQCCAIAQSLV